MDLEPGLRIAFVLSMAVALFCQATGSVAANVQFDDVIAGRQPSSALSDLRRFLIVAQNVSLLVAALSVAVAWHQTARHPLQRARHPAVVEGLVTAIVGACLGVALTVALTIWSTTPEQPTTFEQLRLRLWLGAAQGFAWPLVVLGLGLMTFFESHIRDRGLGGGK